MTVYTKKSFYNRFYDFREAARKPKLFFVSSKSTTSTINTSTFCYSFYDATSNTAAGSCKRKRSIKSDQIFDIAENIETEAEANHDDVMSGMDDATSERLVVKCV